MKHEGTPPSGKRSRGAAAGGVPAASPPQPDQPSEEALESLERLQALGTGAKPHPRSAAPVRRPKMPSVSRRGLSWPRLAAPAVFLAAVLIVFSLAIQSGVVGGSKAQKPVVKVSAKAKPSPGNSATSTYKVYVVKSGDTLSAIAAKFTTTVTDLEDLNPKLDLTTIQPGQKIKVPR